MYIYFFKFEKVWMRYRNRNYSHCYFFFIYIVGINSWYRKCLVRLRDVGGGWRLVGERL